MPYVIAMWGGGATLGSVYGSLLLDPDVFDLTNGFGT